MSKDLDAPRPAGGSPTPPPRDLQGLLPLVNGILVGVGMLYLTTRSIAVTIIGAAAALVLMTLYLIMHR